MTPPDPHPPLGPPSDPAAFVKKWAESQGSVKSNSQPFLLGPCDVLNVPHPDPTRADDRDNAYVSERFVQFTHGDGTKSSGWIDLYKRGCFVLESKQSSAAAPDGPGLFGHLTKTPKRKGMAVQGGSQWDEAMEKARGQAEGYVRALPASEEFCRSLA